MCLTLGYKCVIYIPDDQAKEKIDMLKGLFMVVTFWILVLQVVPRDKELNFIFLNLSNHGYLNLAIFYSSNVKRSLNIELLSAFLKKHEELQWFLVETRKIKT